MRSFIILSILLVCAAGSLQAQNRLALKQKIGDKYFKNMSYLQAIATYEDLLKEDPANTSLLPNLAIAYRKINDMQNAEKIFAQVVKLYPADTVYTLAYAQVLATNGKYAEAQQYYKRYAELKPFDSRGKTIADAYAGKVLFESHSEYRVDIANFNSGQSDFSPVFYKNGLIFCSNRNYSTSVRRLFEWDQSSFLNLYYISDTSKISMAAKTDTAAGSARRRVVYYNDDDTRTTSNDTRTMGVVGHKYIDTTGMFVTAAVLVEPFSGKLNTKYHEGPAVFTRDQKTIYFTRNNYYHGRARKSEQGVTNLEIYTAHFKDGVWSNGKPLNINNNDYSIGHPALAKGDTVLYFVSDMPGGIGGTDIYRSYLREGKWSTPENLGRPVNTEGNELFPYFDSRNNLYFASDGHPGLGGLDIFRASLSDYSVVNPGAPLNSSYDDFGIALNEDAATGYMSSNRRRGVNDDDIYCITIPYAAPFTIQVVDSSSGAPIANAAISLNDAVSHAVCEYKTLGDGTFSASLNETKSYTIAASAGFYTPKTITAVARYDRSTIIVPLVKMPEGCTVAGTILDKDSRLPVAGARIVIFDKTSRDTVYDYTVGETGAYQFSGLKPRHEYDMDVSRSGYFNKPATRLVTSAEKCLTANGKEFNYRQDFDLEKIIIGKAIKIENIYFNLAKYNIRSDAAKELDKIVKLMQENPDIIIELSSHTDCRASAQYNMTLSDNRAKASANYIISKGISPDRIIGKGYGETKLVNNCACESKQVVTCTEEQHQANRRTEFKVTGFLDERLSLVE